MNFITAMFNENYKSVKKLEKIADKVMLLDNVYSNMSDEQLKNQTIVLKERLNNGESVNDILVDAFAVCREAAFRVNKMKHFKVQIMGGIALHQGRIAQMRTGEGKTLVSTLPAYLNALTGKGVHIVTVNEYLAKRDAEWMGKIHRFLGLTVGVIVSDMDKKEKQDAYNMDITYATNNELGFDYLRDNMVTNKTERVQRGHNFAIIDEVDSILIDEARTPLIISGRGMKSSDAYVAADKFVRSLNSDDISNDIEKKIVVLTESGVEKAERYFKVECLSDIENIELNHHINNALRAHYTMKLDNNYIVHDGEILIVDEFTGRVMAGRRYSEGLHQAIEAKEGVEIKNENKTIATITFQNYFRLYAKLSGMTGTAKTEETEFNKIYNLDVVVIPTNLPMIRIDASDIIYQTEKYKFEAIADEVERRHKKGQPVLVGTVTVEKSELMSDALKRRKLSHHVLNAKNHQQEGELIAQAGRLGAITIATNMAGRGTDILLGGNPEYLAKRKMLDENYTEDQIAQATSYMSNMPEEIKQIKAVYEEYYKDFKSVTDEEKKKVIEAGGLCVIGSERHESRRIDDQLRGRSGRQGDPGDSVFYISLEDDLAKRFGGDRMLRVAAAFKIAEDVPFQVKMLSKSIETAQKKIEGINFSQRSSVLEFDNVMNTQRELIYNERNKVLDGENVHDEVVDMIAETAENAVRSSIDEDKPYFEWDLNAINANIEDKLVENGINIINDKFVEDCMAEEVVDKIKEYTINQYEAIIKKGEEYGINLTEHERLVMLRVVDTHWMDNIDQMKILEREVFAQAYGNQDPVIAYKRQSYKMFEEMIENIRGDVAKILYRTDIDRTIEIIEKIKIQNNKFNIAFSGVQGVKLPAKQVAETPKENKTVSSKKEPGRNDMCPCGSGKKYKNCCGK